MGLLSSSNSSSSTTNNTTTQNAGFNDLGENSQAIALQGDNNSIQLTDQGAVAKAFDFASDFSADLGNQASTTVREAITAVTENARAETENIAIQLGKFALYGGLIFGAVMIFRGRK
jgi:hypothetical protein